MQIKCSWIENRISIEPDGFTRPCCGEISNSARIANINDGIISAFNDIKLFSLKDELLKNGYSEYTDFACKRCKEVEQVSKSSLRTNTRYLSDKRELKGIQFKLSNRCQLACAHCGPTLSTEWAKLMKIKPHVTSVDLTESLLNELIEILPNLSEIKFTGGEPFLDPTHYKILEALKDHKKDHCQLIYITNGLIKPRLDLWQGYKNVRCIVSVDGFEDTYEWFRRNANWNELTESIKTLDDISDVSIAFSITPWTVNNFYDVKKYFSKYTVTPINVVVPEKCNLLKFPKHIAVKYFHNSEFIEMTSDTGNLEVYKNFAKYWDSTWNTPGLSEKLYPWLNEL